MTMVDQPNFILASKQKVASMAVVSAIHESNAYRTERDPFENVLQYWQKRDGCHPRGSAKNMPQIDGFRSFPRARRTSAGFEAMPWGESLEAIGAS
jgi:hypothetical protein